MKRDVLDPCQKAARINMDPSVYGTLAELGVGPAVAAWFLRAGGGSGIIAKMVHSRDSTLADAMYGDGEDSVGQQRLETILNLEFDLLLEELTSKRGGTTAFFVFADTVTAEEGANGVHGWMGIRFQARPLGPPAQIIVHARLFDHQRAQEAALGVLGVNLIYGARHFCSDPEALLRSLLDHVVTAQVAVDCVEFSGQHFSDVDNRQIALKLVEHGLAPISSVGAANEVDPLAAVDPIKRSRPRGYTNKPRPRQGLKPARGGLIDSLHLAGMPKAA